MKWTICGSRTLLSGMNDRLSSTMLWSPTFTLGFTQPEKFKLAKKWHWFCPALEWRNNLEIPENWLVMWTLPVVSSIINATLVAVSWCCWKHGQLSTTQHLASFLCSAAHGILKTSADAHPPCVGISQYLQILKILLVDLTVYIGSKAFFGHILKVHKKLFFFLQIGSILVGFVPIRSNKPPYCKICQKISLSDAFESIWNSFKALKWFHLLNGCPAGEHFSWAFKKSSI